MWKGLALRACWSSRRKYPILQSRTKDELPRMREGEMLRGPRRQKNSWWPTRRACICQVFWVQGGQTQQVERSPPSLLSSWGQPALPVSRSSKPQQERCGSLKSASCRPLWHEDRRHGQFRHHQRLAWARNKLKIEQWRRSGWLHWTRGLGVPWAQEGSEVTHQELPEWSGHKDQEKAYFKLQYYSYLI